MPARHEGDWEYAVSRPWAAVPTRGQRSRAPRPPRRSATRFRPAPRDGAHQRSGFLCLRAMLRTALAGREGGRGKRRERRDLRYLLCGRRLRPGGARRDVRRAYRQQRGRQGGNDGESDGAGETAPRTPQPVGARGGSAVEAPGGSSLEPLDTGAGRGRLRQHETAPGDHTHRHRCPGGPASGSGIGQRRVWPSACCPR